MVKARDIPADVLPLIVSHLNNRIDLYNATLVNRTFYTATVAILYEELDSRLVSTDKGLIIHHPAYTLLQNPKLARYVRSVKENGKLHGAPQTRAQHIHLLAVRALSLCTSLNSFTWVDDSFLPDEMLLSILGVLKSLPLRELTIRTFKNLGPSVWDTLHQLKGLSRISIFCMEGPPRILQGWSETLAPTLTHLDLGRCSGVPPTLLIGVFSHLQSLTHLRIKGAHSPSLPYFIAQLPRLLSLDTDYSDAGNVRPVSGQLQVPALEKLTLRASSIDAAGPVGLWGCTQILLSNKTGSLREFRLQTFSTLGETSVPRPFILFLAQIHGQALQRFLVGTTLLTLGDVACLCDMFPKLEELSCAFPNYEMRGIRDATAHAYNLRSIRINRRLFSTPSLRVPLSKNLSNLGNTLGTSVTLTPKDTGCDPDEISAHEDFFSIRDAEEMMLRPRSCLRQITVGLLSFKGEWVHDISAQESVRFKLEQVQLEDMRGEA
ncbi:hypothetical protein ACEPAH_7277 [Sanghuangporus vaninii]